MKQFQMEYTSDEQLLKELDKIALWEKNTMTSGVCFQIFAETMDHEKIHKVCDAIKKTIPSASYIGASTNGNIILGAKSESDIVVVCSVFEYPTSKFEVLQYELNNENYEAVTADLIKKVDERPWGKGCRDAGNYQGNVYDRLLPGAFQDEKGRSVLRRRSLQQRYQQ